ncbi:MAG: SOS response-associated peptidase [Pseudomonadota bacterium]
MCGRMVMTTPQDEMAQLFEAVPANDLPITPNFNVCPTNDVAVLTSLGGLRRLSPMRWGFLPRWYKTPSDGPLLINARSETIAEKPAFREAARSRRGIVLADGFYEWTKDAAGARDPWFVYRGDGAPMALAAVWQSWAPPGEDPVATCAIVTAPAPASLQALHHRVPVILSPRDWPLWLGEAGKGAAVLMRSCADDLLKWHRVDRAVNSNRASGAALITPIGGLV